MSKIQKKEKEKMTLFVVNLIQQDILVNVESNTRFNDHIGECQAYILIPHKCFSPILSSVVNYMCIVMVMPFLSFIGRHIQCIAN